MGTRGFAPKGGKGAEEIFVKNLGGGPLFARKGALTPGGNPPPPGVPPLPRPRPRLLPLPLGRRAEGGVGEGSLVGGGPSLGPLKAGRGGPPPQNR